MADQTSGPRASASSASTTGPVPTPRRIPLWLVILAGGLITSISLGVRSTFGLFLEPVVETLQTTKGSFGLAVAVQNLIWGLSQPVAGAISDRYGAPRVLAAGSVLYAFAMWLMAQADTSGMVLLSGGFIAGIAVGAASFAVVLSSVGRLVDEERRTVALGVVSAAGSLGQFALIPIADRQIDAVGWRDTAVLMAVITLLVIVAAPLLRGTSNAEVAAASGTSPDADGNPLSHDLRRARHSMAYWLLNAGFFVCGFHVTFIGTHLKSYVQGIGQVGSEAAIALSLIGLFNVFGSLAAGWLGARYSNTKLLAGIYALRALVIALYILIPASSTTTIIFGAAIGTLWLGTVPLTSAIVSMQFGTRNSGALFGIVFLSHQLGSFLGAWLGGSLADATGSYTLMWWLAVALGVGAMVCHLSLDEGPVPDPPPPPASRPIVATGAAGIAALAITTAGLGPSLTADTEAAAAVGFTAADASNSFPVADGSTGDQGSIWGDLVPAWCHLGIGDDD